MSEETSIDDGTEYSREDEIFGEDEKSTPVSVTEEKQKFLSHDEASNCLWMLGKTDSGLKYAYLAMDASDRELTNINVIPTFRNVIYVNVSGNKLDLEALEVLTSMTYLLMLQADRNRLESAYLEPMLYLQVLTLNRNNITDTNGISHRLLECLELNYNKIRTVALNPYVLENLKVLELRGNLLSTTNGIFFPTLVHLYLAENQIDRIEGLENLVNLEILHLRDNNLSNLDGFDARCAKLSYVNLRQNDIRKISEMQKLRSLSMLETVIVSENPAIGPVGYGNWEEEGEDDATYRVTILVILPNLKRINKDPVLDEERDEASQIRRQMLEDGTSFTKFDVEAEDE